MRGEYHGRHGNHQHAWELPPRARRIRNPKQPREVHCGTTSACAENTAVACSTPSPVRNYLRVRGEYSATRQENRMTQELPPRARRIPSSGIVPPASHGTTSACAENTNGTCLPTSASRNYLRVRGEYVPGFGIVLAWWELPPRARRIHMFENVFDGSKGTTSACAENTIMDTHGRGSRGNYLRVRGEYLH